MKTFKIFLLTWILMSYSPFGKPLEDPWGFFQIPRILASYNRLLDFYDEEGRVIEQGCQTVLLDLNKLFENQLLFACIYVVSEKLPEIK